MAVTEQLSWHPVPKPLVHIRFDQDSRSWLAGVGGYLLGSKVCDLKMCQHVSVQKLRSEPPNSCPSLIIGHKPAQSYLGLMGRR